MSSIKEITGGSDDLNPQFVSAVIIQPSTNAFGEINIPLPVLSTPVQKGKASVFELLHATFYSDPFPNLINAQAVVTQLTTQSQTDLIAPSNVNFIAGEERFQLSTLLSATPNISVLEENLEKTFDLTDKAGHGLVIRGPNLFLGINSTSTTSPFTVHIKLLFRIKFVGIEEFLLLP